ncbi:class I mannose-6-phosphate isomerase [Microlunatus speluncae]|uniref:class I mannose-6-phosphate isomerase n=1 Tax=Microlunatus speluncae TaxID=2594267 RepID=UPI00126667EA|nr:hypothetical protein [Microlunatus speluncae]
MDPIVLGPNQPAERPYRGGVGIARLRGIEQPSAYSPEDFVASTVEIFAGEGVGLTRLEDGRTLREAIQADPTGYLGAEHVASYGDDPHLLVKLLDTEERLFVHFHPGDTFAEEYFPHYSGKAEAWHIVDVRGEPVVYLGFAREVSEATVASWFMQQAVDEFLAAMNPVPVRPGDTIFVPAGVAHSLGAGITMVELQQASDLSILLEYRGFPDLTLMDSTLGLGPAIVLPELDRSGWDADRLATLIVRAGSDRPLPPAAETYFRLDRVRPGSSAADLPAGYAVLVVLAGDGRLTGPASELPLRAGMTVLVPAGAGPQSVSGDGLELLCCRPPAPSK